MKKSKPLEPRHHTHLDIKERVIIEECLKRGESFRSIAAYLEKSPSTISREVKNHSVFSPSRKNDCLYKRDCKVKYLCDKPRCSVKLCKSCKYPCKYKCSYYKKETCKKLEKPPFVCTGCNRINFCEFDQKIYEAKKAHEIYRNMLIDRRSGFDLTNEQLVLIDSIVSPLLKQGQSPYHVKKALGNELPICESTLRKLIDRCELDARNIDLRRKVKQKPRKKRPPRLHNEKITLSKLGRKYEDYIQYIHENEVTTVQMDCVEGAKRDKAVLLTLHFPVLYMQLAYIMEDHTSDCVVETLDKLEEALGTELFKKVFPVILTDNGHEFTDINGMERSIHGGKRTKIFFCDPNRSDQKGACENNHRYIRYIIPKGRTLEKYDQFDINLMMNHINSMYRKEAYGSSAYDLAMNVLPEDFFILLGLEKIPPKELTLTPALLAKKVDSTQVNATL